VKEETPAGSGAIPLSLAGRTTPKIGQD